MREKIEQKIDDIIESILAKDASEITYSEYKILDCRSKDLKYREEQAKNHVEMAELITKTFGGFGTITEPLPEPKEI